MALRGRKKPTRADLDVQGSWERALGLAPGEQAAESFVAYFEPEKIEGELAEAFGLRDRGELVNAVFTDRGRLVLRAPDGASTPIAFDSKRAADVEVLGPTDRRLTGANGGAERTHLVEVSSHGVPSVRIIVPESGVVALVRWSADRPDTSHGDERVSA